MPGQPDGAVGDRSAEIQRLRFLFRLFAAGRYRYRVGGQQAPGAAASPVTITCDIRGGARTGQILGTVPEITQRLGLDQHPVDLVDPAARAWLEAFVWPEHTGDLAVLRAAIDLALSSAAVTVVPGDAVTDTARLLGGLPGREPVVVFTASLLSYLSVGARTAFVGQIEQAAARRPVAWVFAETPGLVAGTDTGLSALAGPVSSRNTLYLIGASLRSPGYRDDALLALADPYLRWLAPARELTDTFSWLPVGADER